VQETRNDKNSALKILAKYARVDDPEILTEVYRGYSQNHLQKSISVDLEGVNGLLKGLDSEAAGANPAREYSYRVGAELLPLATSFSPGAFQTGTRKNDPALP
jgi:hypothetical protein